MEFKMPNKYHILRKKNPKKGGTQIQLFRTYKELVNFLLAQNPEWNYSYEV